MHTAQSNIKLCTTGSGSAHGPGWGSAHGPGWGRAHGPGWGSAHGPGWDRARTLRSLTVRPGPEFVNAARGPDVVVLLENNQSQG